MSLFSSLLGSITGSNQRKAITQATDAQNAAGDKSIAELQRQFDATQSNLQPFVDAGKSALQSSGGILDLLGLNGADKQAAGLAALQGSPMFQSLFNNGSQAITQSASATGGLRGGNVQRSLADFGSDTFAKTLQQQLGNLGSLATGGASTGGTLGGLGAANSSNIGNIYIGQGANTAGGILGKAASTDQMWSNLIGNFGKQQGQSGGSSGGGSGFNLSSMFNSGGGGGGGGSPASAAQLLQLAGLF